MGTLTKKSISFLLIAVILAPSLLVPSFVFAQSAAGGVASSVVACTGILNSVGSSISGYLGGSGSGSSGSQKEVPVAENDQRKKENCTDAIFYNAGKLLIAYLTNSIINWINTGFEGDPTFISNPKAFFKDVANEVSGQIIQQFNLAGLCQPFKPQILIALAQVPTFGQRYKCTALDVLDNLENFQNDFSQGGWTGWFTILQPQNNFYSTLYNAEAERARRIEEAGTYKRDELAQNNGFFSLRKCTAYDPEYEALKASGKENTYDQTWKEGGFMGCVDTEVVTPGKFIVEQGIKVNNSPIDQLISADEVNEMLAAIFNALVNKLITDGFRKINEDSSKTGAAWNTGILDLPALKKILGEIKIRGTNYYNYRKESVKVLTDTITVMTDTTTCYTDTQTRTGVDQSQKIAALQTQKTNLENKLIGYKEKMKVLEDAAPVLESLILEAAKKEAEANIAFLTAQYSQLIEPIAPSAREVTDAQTDLSNEIVALSAAQTELASCRQALPPSPVTTTTQ